MVGSEGEILNFEVSKLLENYISEIANVTSRNYFIRKLKDILRYTCIKLFSGLFFNNPGEIYVFSGLSFKNPEETLHNPKSVRDL